MRAVDSSVDRGSAVRAIIPDAQNLPSLDEQLAEFWSECISPAQGGRIGSTALYEAFVRWCKQAGYAPPTHTAFALRVKETRKPRRSKSNGRQMYLGIVLLDRAA